MYLLLFGAQILSDSHREVIEPRFAESCTQLGRSGNRSRKKEGRLPFAYLPNRIAHPAVGRTEIPALPVAPEPGGEHLQAGDTGNHGNTLLR